MNPFTFTRRESLHRMGTGMGVLGLAGILADEGVLASSSGTPLAPKQPHFAPRAKHIIHLFMNGGPSQVDTFDPKPALEKYNGQRPSDADLKTGTTDRRIADVAVQIQKVRQIRNRSQRHFSACRFVH